MASPATRPCEPCKYRGIDSTAVKYCKSCQEHLCKDCVDLHKSFKLTRTHILLSCEDQNSLQLCRDMDNIRLCKEHKNKIIEFYCIDHGAMLCSLCLFKSEHHKNCTDKIVEIESVGKSIMGSKFPEKVRDEFQRILSSSRLAVKEIKQANDETRKTAETCKCQIETLRKKMIEAFDRQTRHIVQHAIQFSQKVNNENAKTIENIETIIKTAEENENVLKSIVETGNPDDVFRFIISILEQLEDFRTNIEQLENDIHKYELVVAKGEMLEQFDKNKKPLIGCHVTKTKIKWVTPIERKLTKQEVRNHVVAFNSPSSKEFSSVFVRHTSTCKSNAVSISLESAFQEPSVIKDDTKTGSVLTVSTETATTCDTLTNSSDDINVEMENEMVTSQRKRMAKVNKTKKHPANYEIELNHGYTFCVSKTDKKVWLGGIAVLKDERLVISDFNNSRLVLLGKDYQIIMLQSIGYEPGHISLLRAGCLAVCLMKTNQILLIDVEENKLRENKYIQTMHHPKCVQPVEENMLVSSQDGDGGWFMYIMSTEGQICRQLKFARGLYDGHRIAVQTLTSEKDNHRIIQVCEVTNMLQCFESDGSFVFSYDVERGSSVITDSNGYIYVIRYTGEIQVLSPNGDYLLRLHRQAMHKAKFVAFNSSMDKLFISTYKNPHIHVVNVKRTIANQQ